LLWSTPPAQDAPANGVQQEQQLELQQMSELEASILDVPEESEVDEQATQVRSVASPV
jgi:hypothetical protein